MDESAPRDDPSVPPDSLVGFESLDDAASVLVLGSGLDPATTEGCFGLLTRSPPAETRVVAVTYKPSPDRIARQWDTVVGERPAELFVVSVDGDGVDPPEDPGVTYRQARATDLTGLGIEIQRVLDAVDDDDGKNTRVCFDSLTALLMYVDERVAFRFVRTVAGYVLRVGATIHLHLDPAAHEAQTVSVFHSVVDAVVDTRAAGDAQISHR